MRSGTHKNDSLCVLGGAIGLLSHWDLKTHREDWILPSNNFVRVLRVALGSNRKTAATSIKLLTAVPTILAQRVP
jgi:hypothetical protein